MLMVDALFPADPAALITDCQSIGASGAFAYVSRPGGVGDWTPAHVQALRNAGLRSIPIVVPPSIGGPISPMLDAANNFGFSGGPIVVDLEPPNLPPSVWEENFDQTARDRGFWGFDYGTPTNLGLYAGDDPEWFAQWFRTGILDPIPPHPPKGWMGWQFVNDVKLPSGSFYDVSVIDPFVFLGDIAAMDQILELLRRINIEVGFDDAGNITPNGVAGVLLSASAAHTAALQKLTDMVTASAPSQDATALADIKAALTAVSAKIDAKFAGFKETV